MPYKACGLSGIYLIGQLSRRSVLLIASQRDRLASMSYEHTGIYGTPCRTTRPWVQRKARAVSSLRTRLQHRLKARTLTPTSLTNEMLSIFQRTQTPNPPAVVCCAVAASSCRFAFAPSPPPPPPRFPASECLPVYRQKYVMFLSQRNSIIIISVAFFGVCGVCAVLQKVSPQVYG